MGNILTDLADGVRRLQKIKAEMSAVELREEILALRELLASIRETALAKDEEIADLRQKLKVATSGEGCPICREGELRVVTSRPHEHFAFAGLQTRVLECTACKHREERMHDPSGITKGK